MVVEVVAIIAEGDLCIYDSITGNYATKEFVKVLPWEKDKIDGFFKELKILIPKSIENLYICLSFGFYNDIRKKIMNVFETCTFIKSLHLVSNIFNGALAAVENIANIFDSLWIFCNYSTTIGGSVWEMKNTNELTIVTRFEMNRSTWNGYPSKKDLTKIKGLLENEQNLMSKAPCAYVLQNGEKFNENDFKEIFCGFKNIYFSEPEYSSFKLLENLRNLCKRKNIIIREVLGRNVMLYSNQKILFEVPLHSVLPFSKKCECDIEYDNSTLKIYEDVLCVQRIEIKKKCKLTVTITADIFGIYEVKWQLKNCEDNFVSFLKKISKQPNKSENENFVIPPTLPEYDSTLNAIGIDFGTTECCAFVIRKSGPEGVVLDDFTAQRTMPSYISVKDLNRPCGQVVIKRIENKEDITVFDIKKMIGKKLEEVDIDPLWPFKVTSRCNQIFIYQENWNYDVAKLCSFLFKQIKEKAEEFQAAILHETVITVPLAFKEEQKEAVKDAAEWARWKNVHFLPEPIAAIFGYSYEKSIPNNSVILLFDFGGATTDICIAKISQNEVKILMHNGDYNLGGRDFDKLLINYFDEILINKYRINSMENYKKYRLMRKCVEIKHNLSIMEEDSLDVDAFEFDNDDIIPITKANFETMTKNLIESSKNLILETVKKAKLKPTDISILFQVGGGCRMPMIKKMLSESFPEAEHRCSIYPEWVTAKGAALYAYSLKKSSI